MKRFVRTILTRRQVAEIMLRTLIVPEKYKEICIEKTMALPDSNFLREARKSTHLDIAVFGNKFVIRYKEYDKSEVLPIDIIKKRISEFVR